MKNTLFITISTLSLPYLSMAQELNECHQYEKHQLGHHILNIGTIDSTSISPDSIRSLIDMFYLDQFRHFQDPQAPYFMFMSKDANLAMGIGGVVRMRAWVDWYNSIPANGFVPYLIPTNESSIDRNLAATPAGTALFFKVIGRNSKIGNYLGYIECNFDGYENVGFKLKKAYVSINDFTIGYTLTTFSDPSTNPPTIDGGGPNGTINKSAIMIRWMHKLKHNWVVASALEIPRSRIKTDNLFTKTLNDWAPDLISFAQYEWDQGNQHIRLSGLLRLLSYKIISTNERKSKIGWGVQLSSIFKPFPKLTIFNSINTGQGYASYSNDLQIGYYDLVPNQQDIVDLYAPWTLGVTLGLKYNFTPYLYSAIALSEMRYLPRHTNIGNDYKYGLYGAINLFWDITPRLQIGIEYLYGKRTNFNKVKASSNRCDALFQFSF